MDVPASGSGKKWPSSYIKSPNAMSAQATKKTSLSVPFFRPSITEAEIEAVVDCLRSGWLTTGPNAKRFETQLAEFVGAKHAVAVNSCTAALHLAVEAHNLTPGQAVLVPTMTFAATAEIVRYQGAVPILVDCDSDTFNMDLNDARRKVERLRSGKLGAKVGRDLKIVGILPVHVSGLMMDVDAITAFAREHSLWVVEDAAHALPAAWRKDKDTPWQRCGQGTAAVTCFSFYANKTITTGEGGMAVTDDSQLADRMRMMSLHGLSHDAWGRYSGGSWDYRIIAPGYKYNLTDMAAALGVQQLAKAEELRVKRQRLASEYDRDLGDLEHLELPVNPANRLHSWHLYPVRLRLDRLTITRNQFIEELKARGVGCSVHWRPLHLHPYYAEHFAWDAAELPEATRVWERVVTLPLFPDMTRDEHHHVVTVIHDICREHGR